MFFYQENVGYADKQVMRWFNLLIFIAIMLTVPAIADEHSSLDTSATKDAVIEELIKIETENKALHLGARELKKFSDALEGEDRFNCFEKRCINEGQLQLTLTGVRDGASFFVDLGGHSESISASPKGNSLGFYGTLGNIFVGQLWANACRNKRLTRLLIKNNDASPQRIDMIELKLDNGNNVVKTIFKVEQPFLLAPNKSKTYTITDIKKSNAYRSARVASCQD